jgi:hypothetical protein
VYEEAEGRQYVQDDNGVKVYGTWVPLEVEPIVAEVV